MTMNRFFQSLFFFVTLVTASQSSDAADPLAGGSGSLGNPLEEIQAKANESVRGQIQGLNIPGLRLELKGFESENTGDGYGLAFDYALSKGNQLDLLALKANEWNHDWALDFSTKGSLAFKKGTNPMNFQQAGIAIRGHLNKATNAFRDDIEELLGNAALIELSREAADCTTESIRTATCTPYFAVKNAMEQSLGFLTTVHYGLEVGHETDQEFDATQQTIGAFVAVKLFDARAAATLGKLNLFDYPFAVLRNLTGRADCQGRVLCFRPSGRSFPSFLFAIDRVYPDKETARTVAGDDSEYWRAHAEATFSTPVAYYRGVDVYFTASLRHYREIGPSKTVVSGGLDSTTLTTITVGGREGLFVSYVDGDLPLDAERDQSLQMGWKFNF